MSNKCIFFQVPPPLALRWNIVPHSTVRIKPVKSAIKVASSVRLQALKVLVRASAVHCLIVLLTWSYVSHCFSLQAENNDEDIRTCFLDWLHSQSHEPLACLTPRSGDILLHGPDGDLLFFFLARAKAHRLHQLTFPSCVAKLEFAISVLRPEPEGDPADQLFLLTPAVIQNTDILVK